MATALETQFVPLAQYTRGHEMKYLQIHVRQGAATLRYLVPFGTKESIQREMKDEEDDVNWETIQTYLPSALRIHNENLRSEQPGAEVVRTDERGELTNLFKEILYTP